MNEKKKLPWIDNLRGWLILLVVLGHCIQHTLTNYQSDILFRYIYSFHMPLFVFVSGYVSYKNKIQCDSVKKRFFQLMVPFVVWTGISALISSNASVIINVILRPEQGLWFLWALFFISVINTLCCHISYKIGVNEEIVNIVVAAVLMITMRKYSYFAYPTIAKFYLYYIVGFYVRKHDDFFSRYGKCMMFPALLLFVVSAYFFQLGHMPSFLSGCTNPFYGILFNACVAVFAIVGFVEVFKCCFDKHMFLSRLGGVTLGVYAIHRPIMSLFPLVWMNHEGTLYYVELTFLWSIVSALSYGAVLLLNKNKYTAFLLNGKR